MWCRLVTVETKCNMAKQIAVWRCNETQRQGVSCRVTVAPSGTAGIELRSGEIGMR